MERIPTLNPKELSRVRKPAYCEAGRIPPSERLSKGILELIQELREQGDNRGILSKLMELGIRKFIQELLEKEVEKDIGKDSYEQEEERNCPA